MDDPYGPRIISLDPTYHSNPYILAAGLADVDRYPQLALPASPSLSEDEQERPLGFPGARLKHTQTIMGGRSGGLGLRVNAKRMSASKRLSTLRQAAEVTDMKNFLSDNAPVQEAVKSVSHSTPEDNWIKPRAEESPEPALQVQQATARDEVAKVVQFVPKFRNAAEMEKKRQIRMAARRGAATVAPVARPIQPQNLSFDSSSDEADVPAASESSTDEDEDPSAANNMDEGDEFDPCVGLCIALLTQCLKIIYSVFATTRTAIMSDSVSDGASVLSTVASSIPTSAGVLSSHTNTKSRPRLSPVSELVGPQRLWQQSSSKQGNEHQNARHGTLDPARSRSASNTSSKSTTSAENIFVKRKIILSKPLKSSLTAMLASSTTSNPFAEMYAAISGRGEVASTNVQVYFPHTQQPHGKPMNLNVRRDATVEEVIGFALWNYWEEGWLPKLDEGLSEEDPKRKIKLSAVGWILRIAEDDGEVDDDFPREYEMSSRKRLPIVKTHSC